MQVNYVLSTKFSNENTIEPVLLAEVKKYLRISEDETYDDELITQLIKTARQQLEGYLNISLIPRTVTARVQNEVGYMLLPYSAPNIAITAVIDDNGNTLATTAYSLKGDTFSAFLSSTATPANNFYEGSCGIVNVTYNVSFSEIHDGWVYYTANGTEGNTFTLDELKKVSVAGRLYRDGIEYRPSGNELDAMAAPVGKQFKHDPVEGTITFDPAIEGLRLGEQVDIPINEEPILPSHLKNAIMQQTAWLYERGRGDELTNALSPVVKINLKPHRKVI